MSYVGKINVSETEYPISATLYGECSTLASTAEKAVTLANFDTLMTGVAIAVKFLYSNTADNPTLNVNGTGAKSIYKSGVLTPGKTEASSWAANAVVTFIYDGESWMMESGKPALSELQNELLAPFINAIYPVGSIYMSTSSTSPATLFGVGTWEQIQNTFLLAAGSSYNAGSTGGAATVTLTTSQIPAHTHGRKSLSGRWFMRMFKNGTDGMSWLPGAGATDGIMKWELNSATAGTIDVTWSGNQKLSLFTVDASHEHTSVGGNGSHNNMPPYLAVYMWKRTA